MQEGDALVLDAFGLTGLLTETDAGYAIEHAAIMRQLTLRSVLGKLLAVQETQSNKVIEDAYGNNIFHLYLSSPEGRDNLSGQLSFYFERSSCGSPPLKILKSIPIMVAHKRVHDQQSPLMEMFNHFDASSTTPGDIQNAIKISKYFIECGANIDDVCEMDNKTVAEHLLTLIESGHMDISPDIQILMPRLLAHAERAVLSRNSAAHNARSPPKLRL